MTKRKDLKIIDVFSGAGGMTLGFKMAGFTPVLAFEKERDFAETYKENFGSHVIIGDIAKALQNRALKLSADVVIGGPPCQGFSNLTGNRIEDPRRKLWRYFMEVVKRSGCRAFVMENVPNFIKSDEGQEAMEYARRLGFTVTEKSVGVLKASDYGVPQNRKRAIIIGSKIGTIPLPSPRGIKRTVREAFVGIPLKPLYPKVLKSPMCGHDLHIGRRPTEKSLQRYSYIPPGGNRFDLLRNAPKELIPRCWIKKTEGGTDLFGRLRWDEPARCTIRTEFYKPEKGRYLHPTEHRPITHWEAARLQSFPDTFKWNGSKMSVAIQIGNAVPPLLAKAIAEQILIHMGAVKRKKTHG